MLRCRGPTETDGVHQIADTVLAVHQGPDERQARRVTEGLENLVGRSAMESGSHDASISPIGEIVDQEFPARLRTKGDPGCTAGAPSPACLTSGYLLKAFATVASSTTG
jgi:hypothetical protein